MTPQEEVPLKKIGVQLQLIVRLLHRRMDAKLTAQGIDCSSVPQGWLMSYLYEHREKAIFQRDVERNFHLRRSSVTGILKNMEKAGLIVRTSVAEDGRLKQISLTDRAIAQHEQILSGIRQNELELLAGFTPEEVTQLRSLLERLYQNLQDQKEDTESLC